MAVLGDGKARRWVTAGFSCVVLGTNTVNQERAFAGGSCAVG